MMEGSKPMMAVQHDDAPIRWWPNPSGKTPPGVPTSKAARAKGAPDRSAHALVAPDLALAARETGAPGSTREARNQDWWGRQAGGLRARLDDPGVGDLHMPPNIRSTLANPARADTCSASPSEEGASGNRAAPERRAINARAASEPSPSVRTCGTEVVQYRTSIKAERL